MYYVYILTNKTNRVLYTGVTNNLLKRIEEHKAKLNPNAFTARYNVHKLVFYETTKDILSAIEREKQIKELGIELPEPSFIAKKLRENRMLPSDSS